MTKITHLLFDLGGVCLTNAWDHLAREAAAKNFNYDFKESEERHKRVVEKIETGEMSRKSYLSEMVFYVERRFSEKEFVEFMEAESKAHPKSFEVLEELRAQNKYHLSVLNNESLELNRYRIEKFQLKKYFTNFFSSCYLGVSKPHPSIYRKVLQITQISADRYLLIDDREKNIEAAAECGFEVLHIPNVDELREKLVEINII